MRWDVFLSFTLSQAGIFTHWLKERAAGWQIKAFINGIGALVTCVGTVVRVLKPSFAKAHGSF